VEQARLGTPMVFRALGCCAVGVLGLAACGGPGRSNPSAPSKSLAVPPPVQSPSAAGQPQSGEPPQEQQRTIEECDKACAGCKVLLSSGGKLREASRPLRDVEQAAIDSYFYSYLQSDECLADERRLDVSAIGTRDDVSSVKMVVDGAFTAPGAKQTVVTFFVGHCGLLGYHSEHYGATFALVFEQHKLITAGADGPTLAIQLEAIDLDGDGVSELVELTADYGSGHLFSAAEVWSLLGGNFQSLAAFRLSSQNCLVPEGEYFESDLLTRWDEQRRALCFGTRRRDIPCPRAP
jgi:hypothetical protein